MLAMDPYPGFEGQFFSMPTRNIVPKPVQRPHPPLWVACSNRETIKLAARLGIGALTFAFVDPAEAKQWVDDYYRIFREECVPIGHTVNPNICMVSSFGLHQNVDVARQRFQDGFRFFQFALGWHYGFGESRSLAAPTSGSSFKRRCPAWLLARPDMRPRAASRPRPGCASTWPSSKPPGVDQVAFIQQGGRNQHEHICEQGAGAVRGRSDARIQGAGSDARG